MLPLDPSSFLDRLFASLHADGIDVQELELDHLCYRVASLERYEHLKRTFAEHGTLLAEHPIGGRPIATYQLHEPFRYHERPIAVVELPAPKDGSPYPEGFEHAEFVIDVEPRALAARYPGIQWDLSGANKPINADVRIGYGGISVKFHRRSLADVIEAERSDH